MEINYTNLEGVRLIWEAALYGRVSTEHEEQQESIRVQEEALDRYAYENGYKIVARYFDEGYSGTDFDRPGIKMLKAEIESGNVNLILVKDLSRIGRNNIMTLLFLDYLSRNDVRLIAINDGYDTLSDEDDIIGIKTWFNERYSKDISRKIRFAFMHKKKMGEYLGAFAPYGYKKSEEHKNKLEVDYYASCVVKDIFELYIKGYGFTKIAAMLQDKGIKNPSSYGRFGRKSDRWDPTTVKKILTNPVYTGCLVQHKYSRKSFKDRTIKRLPKSQWIVVQDTHESIISKDTFALVQDILSKRKGEVKYRSGPKSPHLFASFVYCRECGSALYYKMRNDRGLYRCGKYTRYGKSVCTSHTIYEEELKEIVAEELRNEIKKAVRLENVLEDVKRLDFQKHENEDIKRIDREIGLARFKNEMAYKDRLNGLIDEKMYMAYKAEFDSYILQMETKKESMAQNRIYSESMLPDLVYDVLNLSCGVDRNLLERLVKRIEIGDDASINIHFNFSNTM
jgi:site-specific DNA recombinase